MATHDPKETQFSSHLPRSQSKSQSDDEEESDDAMFMSSSDDDVEIPKSSFEDGKKTEDLQWICLICNKGFSSGKALSGHSRIHAQPNKKHQLFVGINKKNSQNPNNNTLMVQDHNLSTNTCCVCGKTFPSEKSLSGHMRCHPDRNWRGILPPAPTTSVAGKYIAADGNKNSSSSTLSEAEFLRPAGGCNNKIRAEEDRNQIIDSATTSTNLAEELLQWLSKAKRGRIGTKEHTRMCSEPVPDDDVVRNLMMLAEGKFDENVETMQIEKKRRKLKFRDLDTFNAAAAGVDHETNPKNRYKCATCDKSFPTHQALGGHRSSHNKLKNTNTSISVILRDDRETEQLQCTDEVIACSSRFEKEVEVASASPHKCKVCNKSYATGQALGGHMSYHGTSSSSQVAVSSGEASNTGQGEFEFDLNEVPEVEELEDEIMQGTLQLSS